LNVRKAVLDHKKKLRLRLYEYICMNLGKIYDYVDPKAMVWVNYSCSRAGIEKTIVHHFRECRSNRGRVMNMSRGEEDGGAELKFGLLLKLSTM